MSDTAPPLSRRIRQTPLRDLLRGRLTGRLDWHKAITASDLPAETKRLIETAVRRTRLWRVEKVDVARELIAHFTDAAAADVPAAEATAAFGDPVAAARLIRRAKIRQRPMMWHALKWTRRLAVALIVFYIGLAVYFFIGRPSPTVDYVAELNTPIIATPINQRAWPIYREVLAENGDPDRYPRGYRPEDKEEWPAAKKWIEEHPKAVEKIRRAANKPTMGFVLGRGGSADDLARERKDNIPLSLGKSVAELDSSLVQILLPHLNHLRSFARTLAADAELVRQASDGPRLRDNLMALANMGKQISADNSIVITGLLAIGVHALALDVISDTLETSPELLSDDEWRDLAHRLSEPRVAGDFISFKGERMFLYDLVQRTYTNDGDGDGRFTAAGLRTLRAVTWAFSQDPNDSDVPLIESATAPAGLLVMASRRDLIDRYDRIMDAYEAALHRPLREQSVPPADAGLKDLRLSTLDQMRYRLLLVMAPSFNRTLVTAERTLARRDGVQIGIALELYRRRHGAWPQALAELSPAMLPAVPVDPITGGPLHYRIVDGRPVVYSVGGDRDDDGGRSPLRDGKPDPMLAAEWHNVPPQAEGDWVLFP
jgi:hypothetical protein